MVRLLSDQWRASAVLSELPDLTVLLLLAITAPVALAFGFAGAAASRSHIAPLRWFGQVYTSMVRGVPDIVFFLFFGMLGFNIRQSI